MKQNLSQQLRKSFARKGYRFLRHFYNDHNFSFTYEYLRQVFVGGRVPSSKKLKELADSLGISMKTLQKIAVEERISRKIGHYYKEPPGKHQNRVRAKKKEFSKESKADAKIVRMLKGLDDDEKKQVIAYIRFLKKQWRNQNSS